MTLLLWVILYVGLMSLLLWVILYVGLMPLLLWLMFYIWAHVAAIMGNSLPVIFLIITHRFSLIC